MQSWRLASCVSWSVEVCADFVDVGEELSRLMVSMTAMATAQASGLPPKVVPCMPGVMDSAAAFGAEHRAHGDAAGDGLGDGGDVGQDAVVLVGEPLAGASDAALDLVGDEEGSGGVAEFAGGCEELLRDGMDAALALDGLDADGADFGSGARELCAEVGYVVEADELDAGHDGAKGSRYFSLCGGRDGAHGAAVEAVFEREELCADGAAL